MTTKIIIIRESLPASVARDLVSAGVLLGSVGVGIWMDSAAMQWAAAILWVLWMLAKGTSHFSKDRKLTIAQARERLDEIEAGNDSD